MHQYQYALVVIIMDIGSGYVHFTGLHCDINVDECASSPCSESGICVDGINSYDCVCLAGFSGPTCDANTDECQSQPCLNNVSMLILQIGKTNQYDTPRPVMY